MIIDAQLIGGVGTPAIFDSSLIGFTMEDNDPYTDIKEYILSPNGFAHSFSYATEKFVTVFEGAQLRLSDPGGIPPYTYKSTNHSVATVDSNGIYTFHNTGSAKLIMTDSTGARWGGIFNPSLYMLAGPSITSYAAAQPWCESQGGRLPVLYELSFDISTFRRVGSLFGEWGDAHKSGFAGTDGATSSIKSWTSTMNDPTHIWTVDLFTGVMGVTAIDAYVELQVAVLTSRPNL